MPKQNSVAQSRPFDLLASPFWSSFSHGLKRVTFYFWVLWASEKTQHQDCNSISSKKKRSTYPGGCCPLCTAFLVDAQTQHFSGGLPHPARSAKLGSQEWRAELLSVLQLAGGPQKGPAPRGRQSTKAQGNPKKRQRCKYICFRHGSLLGCHASFRGGDTCLFVGKTSKTPTR